MYACTEEVWNLAFDLEFGFFSLTKNCPTNKPTRDSRFEIHKNLSSVRVGPGGLPGPGILHTFLSIGYPNRHYLKGYLGLFYGYLGFLGITGYRVPENGYLGFF